MGQRLSLPHGTSQPLSVKRDQLYVQHDPQSNKILGIWAGTKNDERRCVQNLAVKRVDSNYTVLPEDKLILIDTEEEVVNISLPDPASVNDGHQVIIKEVNAGDVAITTLGDQSVKVAGVDSFESLDVLSTFILDAKGKNWITV